MQVYIERVTEEQLHEKLRINPVVALLGPRQCGKSTIAKKILKIYANAIYLDLELASDRKKLEDPELFFNYHHDKLICLDEIQYYPELFSTLRSIIDQRNRPCQFLILGSASRDLLKQSQTLAGRISYLELSPFLYQEVQNAAVNVMDYWIKGGFPRSLFSDSFKNSLEWRRDFIQSFLFRDLAQFGFNVSALTIEKFWKMCAHSHGQLFNASTLGQSLGCSHTTTKHYLDILSETFMIRVLQPYHNNLKKRLVKTPKIYIRDSGILHALLGIVDFDSLSAHPIKGASWEGMVIENLIQSNRGWDPYFYRTSSGVEIDLILEKGARKIAIECKNSTDPLVGKGFYQALEGLEIDEALIIAPVKSVYPLKKTVWVKPLEVVLKEGF